MSPNLLTLSLASFACITLLILFSRHNRKSGWVKERKSVMNDLIALQMYWDESDMRTAAVPRVQANPVASRMATPQRSSQADNFEFTRQLAGMAEGLRRYAGESKEAAAPEEETVEARTGSGD